MSDVERTTPAQAGNIWPKDHLLHGGGEQFLDIEARILHPPPLASAIPKGCCLVSQDEEPHLRRFLLSRGLVRLVNFLMSISIPLAILLLADCLVYGIVMVSVRFLTEGPKTPLRNV